LALVSSLGAKTVRSLFEEPGLPLKNLASSANAAETCPAISAAGRVLSPA
jgi:hypothetical protein